MNRHVLAVALALLLATAGCLGGVHAPTPDYTREEVTALVVNDDVESNTPKARELYRGYWNLLLNDSFRVHRTLTRNGSVVQNVTVVVDRTRGRALNRWVWPPEGAVSAHYLGVNALYERTRPNATADYSHESTIAPENATYRPLVHGWPALPDEVVFVRYDFEYTGYEDGAYVFEADSLKNASEVPYSGWYWNTKDATNASATLVVDQRGFIRRLTTSVTVRDGSDVRTEEFDLRVTNVNDVSLDRPSWVVVAANAANATVTP